MRALQLIEDRRIEMTEIPEPNDPSFGEFTVSTKAVALNHLDRALERMGSREVFGKIVMRM